MPQSENDQRLTCSDCGDFFLDDGLKMCPKCDSERPGIMNPAALLKMRMGAQAEIAKRHPETTSGDHIERE